MNDYIVRPMQIADLPDLETMVSKDGFSWSKNSLRHSLHSRHLCLVMENTHGLIGFTVTLTVLDEAEILYLAIDRKKRRKGWGRKILLDLLSRLGYMQIHSVFLEVRSSNIVAIKLYSRAGFNEINRRKGYYNDPEIRGDAIIMKLDNPGN